MVILRITFLLMKTNVVTFKVDESLAKAMDGVTNRSEFIRSAILAALDNTCPLCSGSGTLSPEQLKHWKTFSSSHALEKCDDCNAHHLVCKSSPEETQHQ